MIADRLSYKDACNLIKDLKSNDIEARMMLHGVWINAEQDRLIDIEKACEKYGADLYRRIITKNGIKGY